MLIQLTRDGLLVGDTVCDSGDHVDAHPDVARRLVARGHAFFFGPPPAPPAVESADLPPGPESADARPSRRRKGA